MTGGRAACLAALASLLAGCLVGHPAPEPPALRVGVPSDYPPFAVTRDGTPEGFDVDVARRFAAETGRKLVLVPFRWPDLTQDLAAGRFDVAMGGVTMRPERALVGTFTRPVLETRAVVVARRGIADVDQPSVRLAVNTGGHLERLARRRLPHAALRTTTNQTLAGLLARGEVDAILTDDVEAPLLERDLSGTHRLGPFSRDRKAYLGRDPVLIDTLDGWLRDREVDGSLDALRARWLGDDRRLGQTAFASDLGALTASVDLRLSLMPAVAAAKALAGRPVEDAGQEARVVAGARTRAATLGLDPDRAEQMVRAQIAAARAVQLSWLARPAALRSPVGVVDLDTVLRPALERIGNVVLARAADVARARSALPRPEPEALARDLDDGVALPLRLAIARAIVALRD